MERKDILRKLNRLEDLPTLPAVAMKVNSMLHDHNVSIQQLSGAIEKDQSMIARILRLVNSAFFGLRSKVANIPHALTLLGFNTVRNAVVSISVLDAFSGKQAVKGFDPTVFWTHSLAVAVTSKSLGEQTRLAAADECFLAGLVHDIGKIVLAQHFQDLFKRIWYSSRTEGITFYEAERRDAPIDHAKIGSILAKKWQMPPTLVDAIRWHHKFNSQITDQHLLMMVYAANHIVNRYDGSETGFVPEDIICPEVLKTIHASLADLVDWYPEIQSEIQSACQFFLEAESP